MARASLGGRVSAALVATSLLTLAACSDSSLPVEPMAPQSAPAAAQQIAADDDSVVDGEIIVKLKDGSSLDIDQLVTKYSLKKDRKGYAGKFDVVKATKGHEKQLAAILAALPEVEFAEPNYLRHVDAIDSRLWAFYNPGGLNMQYTSGGTGYIPSSYASISDADEDNVQTGYAANGANVTIGSIDTGVDFTHPEFTGRLIAGRDWYANDADPSDTPDEGHGTHTTGTMAGSTVGVAGISGAGPHVNVYVQRVCGSTGCPTTAIVNAINAAADYIDASGNHLVAVNMSLGGTTESTAEKNAIAYATSKGVLVIASAGNSGTSRVACPACDPNAISVSSTTWRDALASYSQYGSGLDISAPGGQCYSNTTPEGCIFSSVVSGFTGGAVFSGPQPGGSYTYMQGTSMAAPQVTGTAAAVASKTGLRGSALRTRILNTADDKGTAGYDTKFGSGRVNTYRAVTNTSLPAGQ
jgi:subtilisin family serine protease